MPLPFILAGLAIAATGVVGHCAKEVANDYEDELNSINRSMERMQDEINDKIRNSKNTFEKKINDLSNQRKKVYDVTLTNFSDSFSKIRNVDFDKNVDFKADISKFKQNLVEYNDNSSYRSDFWSKPSTSVATSLLFGVAGGGIMFAGGFIKSMKISYQIDDAKAERAKLRAECEAAKKQCLQMDSLSQYCKTAYSTISTLAHLTDLAIEQIKNIIIQFGTNYSKYSREEKQKIRMTCNFAIALNDIVNTEIFDENGKINPRFKKYIDGASELIAYEGR